MGRYPRFIPPGSLVEITIRTTQGRFLLRPGPQLTSIVLGVLGRAQRIYPLAIHHFTFMSNHAHLLLSPPDAQRLAEFMRFVDGNLSKEVGRLYGWRNSLWERRYRSVVVSDEQSAQIDRLDYLLSNGCKENLVSSPRDWPGASCVKSWLSGKALKGRWFNRTREYAAAKRGEELSPHDFAEEETVRLTPLPCWRHLPVHRVRARIAARVRLIEQATAERHHANSSKPLGVRSVLERHPHDRPERIKRSPAPLFHTATKAAYWELYGAMSIFVGAFYEAKARLKEGLEASFPPGSFPSPRPFVPT